MIVGSLSVTLNAGQQRTARVSLNGTGQSLLARHHTLAVKVKADSSSSQLCCQTVTFKQAATKKK